MILVVSGTSINKFNASFFIKYLENFAVLFIFLELLLFFYFHDQSLLSSIPINNCE